MHLADRRVQVLVSNILLLPHHTEPNAAMLSHTSAIRQRVEHTRLDVLRFIRKRWLGIRQEGGFDDLEGWALKEISDSELLILGLPISY